MILDKEPKISCFYEAELRTQLEIALAGLELSL